MAERRGFLGGRAERVTPGPLRAGLVALCLLAAAVLGTAPAQAAFLHPTAGVSFGSDGTSSTTFSEPGPVAFNQAGKRLYVLASYPHEVFGFDASTPGTYTPLGGAFPFAVSTYGSSDLATDNSPGSAGNIYYLSEYEGLYGFTPAGSELSGFPVTRLSEPCGTAVDGEGHIWVAEPRAESVAEYSSAGALLGSVDVSETGRPCHLAFDLANEDLYVANNFGGVYRYKHGVGGYGTGTEIDSRSTQAIAFDTADRTLYVAHSNKVDAYNPSGALLEQFATGTHYYRGIAVDETTGAVYVADDYFNRLQVEEWPGVVVPDVTTGEETGSGTVSGHVDPAGGGDVTSCYFEYGASTAYGESVPCEPPAPIAAATDVSAELPGLAEGTTYHYRLVAGNENGLYYGEDGTFITPAPPSVDGYSSANLTATTADLIAQINPDGLDTSYRFEYGTSTGYGQVAPVPDGEIAAGHQDQRVEVHLTELQRGVVYHFRVVATNSLGTTVTGDQTFNFFPPLCPNGVLRQQTGSQYLPDCRAYELVSPEETGNVVLRADGGPPGPYASNPPRFAFIGFLGAVSGTEATNSISADTYVATRTNTGWKTSYVGIPGSQVLGASAPTPSLDFSRFLDFDSGEGFAGVPQPPDRIPYIWNAQDEFFGRWPVSGAVIPGANETKGAFQPSPDFSHLAFSSNNVAFVPNGLVTAPGSAYDYDAAKGTTALISKTAAGADIPQEPGNSESTEEYILFPGDDPYYGSPARINPGVSTDGSHILMSTSSAPYGQFTHPPPPTRLYMRVDDAITYEVSRGHDVDYVGMTADGSKVFFTSPEELTEEDTDSSVDLYMWSEEGDKLTLLSVGQNGAGNSDECNTVWTSLCGVAPVIGGRETDYPIATQSGEIYFYSPEKLDGSKGLVGLENLYVYREGSPHFVASLTPPEEQSREEEEEPVGPVTRIQVSPDGSHMAFVTASPVTSYDNAGFKEMYSYEPASGRILCASCLPDGEPPTANVKASKVGLFMSNDGRTFFSTTDPLVLQDTDEVADVYEFVNGRPQLISSGTSATATGRGGEAGLSGVSADGTDVYFSSYDELVAQDHNGPFLTIYDARTDGGFPYEPPLAPCEAADECHSAGSSPPPIPTVATDGALGARGNAPNPKRHRAGKHHRARKHHRRHRRAGRRHHGARVKRHRGGRPARVGDHVTRRNHHG